MADLFLLSEAQMRRIEPYFPLSHGMPRVDDRRVVSGIVFVIRNGLRWRDAPPIPADEITRSAANVHVIPANAVVARQVAALRPGQRVRARGLLVEATRPDGWRWRSSLRE